MVAGSISRLSHLHQAQQYGEDVLPVDHQGSGGGVPDLNIKGRLAHVQKNAKMQCSPGLQGTKLRKVERSSGTA